MEKIRTKKVFERFYSPALKILIAMKLTIILLFASTLTLLANSSYSQSTRINLNLDNVTVEEALSSIEEQSEFYFLYSKKVIDANRTISITAKKQKISKILKLLFKGTNVNCRVRDRVIVLTTPEILGTSSKLNIQNFEVKGKVTEEDGMPIPGVYIMETGTSNGTVSDMDGNYTISVSSPDATLSFAYVGYFSKEIQVANQKVIDVILIEDIQKIDEVVVVGYGMVKKKLSTGATLNVKGNAIQKQNTNTAMEALQGISPGVSITQTNGQPGSSAKINIRGVGTIGNSSPLYVVDGVRVENIDYLSPSDIESIDVLKDAASCAIYGVNGANGVILVTTKKGKQGKMTITFDSYFGVQNVAKKANMLNAQEYALIQQEAYTNSGADYDFAANVPLWNEIQNGSFTGTNWFDEFANKNAPEQSYSLNIAGGNEKSNYSLGLSFLEQQGIMGKQIDNFYKRKNVRLNSNHVLFEKGGRDIVSVGQTFTYTNSVNPTLGTGDFYGNDIYNMHTMNPWMTVYDENGEFSDPISWNSPQANPIEAAIVRRGNQDPNNNYIVASGTLDISPVENLHLRSSYSVTSGWGSNRTYIPIHELSEISIETEDKVTQSLNSNSSYLWTNTITYDFKLGENHKLSAMLGNEISKSTENLSLEISNYNTIHQTFENAYTNNASTVAEGRTEISGEDTYGSSLLSYFGRVSYDFNEKYLLTATLRRDGSSNFGKDYNTGIFPSVSAGWIISNENFMRNLTTLDYFKLRASWGQNGNQNIGRYQYQTSITPGNEYFFGPKGGSPTEGLYPDIIPFKEVSWETSEQINAGFDAYLLNSRLSFIFDAYKKTTKDWLVEPTIVADLGAPPGYKNGGDITNKGIEIALGWSDRIKDFKYSVNATLAYNKNEVTKIANQRGEIPGAINVHRQIGGDYIYLAEEGYPIGYFWGYQTDGIFQNQEEIDAYITSDETPIVINPAFPTAPGDVRFVDQNDDGVINSEDRINLGDPNPDYIIGFQLNLEYKGAYLAANAYGQFGAQVVKAYRSYGENKANYTTDWLNRWHGEGTSNRLPRVLVEGHPNMQNFSDLYIHNADFVRLSNLTIGYNLKQVFTKLPLQEARIYLTARNLFTITKYDGLDPEVGASGDELDFAWGRGIDIGVYPKARSFQLGVSLKF